LRNRHVQVRGGEVQFHFRGKSGQHHDIAVRDRALARRLRKLHDLPGQELFQYVDDDRQIHRVTSEDVNAYLHAIAGDQFSAKDFRTWAGTLAAADELSRQPIRNGHLTKRQINTAIETVAQRLGNTPAICRKCYIHPGLLESYAPGGTPLVVAGGTAQPNSARASGLRAPEKRLLAFLRAQRRRPHRVQLGVSLPPK
jgi:DNA topoisomerase-1